MNRWTKGEFPYFPKGDAITAFSQTVRTGKNSGKLLVNTGVECDVLVRPTKNDIYGKTYSLTQYDRIAEHLKTHSRAGMKFDIQQLETVGADFVFKAEITGYEKVEIKIDGQQFNVIETASKTSHDIVISKSSLKAGDRRIEMLGYDSKGERQFRAIRNVNVLPSEVAVEKRDMSGN